MQYGLSVGSGILLYFDWTGSLTKIDDIFFSIELSDGLNFGVFFINLKTYTPANPIPLGSSDKNVEGGSRNNRDSVASDKVSKF